MTSPLLTRKHFKLLAELAKRTATRGALTKSQLAILVQELGVFCNQHNHQFDCGIFKAMVYGEGLPKKPVSVRQPILIPSEKHMKE